MTTVIGGEAGNKQPAFRGAHLQVGVRMEDTVWVTPQGPVSLTTYPKAVDR
jgi:hypothetical protein